MGWVGVVATWVSNQKRMTLRRLSGNRFQSPPNWRNPLGHGDEPGISLTCASYMVMSTQVGWSDADTQVSSHNIQHKLRPIVEILRENGQQLLRWKLSEIG